MIIAISQPTFLPYEGYFALINKVEKFVLLDNVQFDKRSWQQRNYLSINDNPKLITIPVISKGKFNQNINQVLIDYKHFDVDKFLSTIVFSYKREKYFEDFFSIIEKIFKKKHEFLCELNINLIKEICAYLDIKTEILKSSEIRCTDKLKKTELLKYILLEMKGDIYYSTNGAKKYLGENKFFPDTSIEIKYFSYVDKLKSVEKKDVNLSILDLIFKKGKRVKEKLNENFNLVT